MFKKTMYEPGLITYVVEMKTKKHQLQCFIDYLVYSVQKIPMFQVSYLYLSLVEVFRQKNRDTLGHTHVSNSLIHMKLKYFA